jgi:hypothetical protein
MLINNPNRNVIVKDMIYHVEHSIPLPALTIVGYLHRFRKKQKSECVLGKYTRVDCYSLDNIYTWCLRYFDEICRRYMVLLNFSRSNFNFVRGKRLFGMPDFPGLITDFSFQVLFYFYHLWLIKLKTTG